MRIRGVVLVLVVGLVLVLSSAGVAVALGLQNASAIVHVRAFDHVWTTHLYTLLIIGALVACWFLLGISFIWCRIGEKRRARAAQRASLRAEPPDQPVRAGRPLRAAHRVASRSA
jgi:uncharacterized membrane protein YciS (DUF1049 family)